MGPLNKIIIQRRLTTESTELAEKGLKAVKKVFVLFEAATEHYSCSPVKWYRGNHKGIFLILFCEYKI
jgi:hypothetical protein